MTAPTGFTRFAVPAGVDDYNQFVMDVLGTAYLDGRRWFHCDRCRSMFVGGLVTDQDFQDETRAVKAHARACRGTALGNPTVPSPTWRPFDHVAGLTDDDRIWLSTQLVDAGLDPFATDKPASEPTAEMERRILGCGHQVGGPFGVAPGTCATCLAWVAENRDLADAMNDRAARRTEPAAPAQRRRLALPLWMLVTVFVVAAGAASVVFQVLWTIAGIVGGAVNMSTLPTFVCLCVALGMYVARMFR